MVKKNQLWRQGKCIFLKMSRYSFIRLFSLFGGWEGCKWETGVEEEWSSSKMKFSIHVDLVSESVCSLFWWRLPSRLLLLCQVRCCLHYWIHSLFWKGFSSTMKVWIISNSWFNDFQYVYSDCWLFCPSLESVLAWHHQTNLYFSNFLQDTLSTVAEQAYTHSEQQNMWWSTEQQKITDYSVH